MDPTSSSMSAADIGSGNNASIRIIDTVIALYPYASDKPHSLAFNRGDTIYVVTKLDSGWWEGQLASGPRGWFPSNYIQRLPVEQTSSTSLTSPVGESSPLQQRQFSQSQQQLPVNSSSSSSQLPRHSIASTAVSTSGTDGSGDRSEMRYDANAASRLTFMSVGSSSSSELQHIAPTSDRDCASTYNNPNSGAAPAGSDYMDSFYKRDDGDLSRLSRKTSVSSYASSQNSEFFSRYRSVDTRDSAYSNNPSFWLPQVSSSGKLIYVNASRLHVTEDLPFERVDAIAGEEEEIPASVVVPKDLQEESNSRRGTATTIDDIQFMDKTDMSGGLFKRSRTNSILPHDAGNSFESSLMLFCDLQDSDFEQTWTEALNHVHSAADKLSESVRDDSLEEFYENFKALSLQVQKISLYIGCPPGAYPSTAQEPDLSLAYRKMMSSLARLGLRRSIFMMIVNNEEESTAARESEKELELSLIAELVTNASNLVQLYQDFKQSTQFFGSQTTSIDSIDVPPTQFDVRFYSDGIWNNVMLTRAGTIVSDNQGTGNIPGSLALLSESYRQLSPNTNDGSSAGDSGLRNRNLSLILEVYDASVDLDLDVVHTLETRFKTLRTICTQLSKLSETAPSSTSVEATQDRSKILLSSLQTFANIVKTITNIIECVDLTRFNACRINASDSKTHLMDLDKILELKQLVCNDIAYLDKTSSQLEIDSEDVLMSLSEKFEQVRLEEVFFSYERQNEGKMKDSALATRDLVKKLIEQLIMLSRESKYYSPKDTRLLAINSDMFDFSGGGVSVAGGRNGPSESRRSSISLRRQDSSLADVMSLAGSQSSFKEDDSPWYLRLEHSDEMVYDKKNQLRGGTIPALIEQLTLHNKLNSEFNVAMLLTFQSFMDARTLFDGLVERFMIQPPEGLTPDEFGAWTEKKQRPIRLRVVNIMKTWLDLYWFEDDSDEMTGDERSSLFDSMLKFAAQLKAQKFPGGVSLYNIVEKRMNNKEPSFKRHVVHTTTRPPMPILPSNLKRFKLSEIDPMEMARQLCIREFKLLVQITAQECLKRAHGRRKKDGSSHIGMFIHNSNCMTNWVAFAILRHSDAKRRANCIRYFIKVAEYCRSLNNFSSMTAIISALYSSTIHRMKKTWEFVSPKNVTKLETMNRLMNSSRNFNEYRDILSLVSSPTIPFFGVYLTDLTFVEDGNADYLDSAHKYVNFAKRIKTASIIENIRQFQVMAYNFEEVPDIQQFLNQGFHQAPSIEEQYETSLNYEPRERPGEPGAAGPAKPEPPKDPTSEKVAKLLAANGIL